MNIKYENNWKILSSDVYNYAFNLKDGTMLEWGRTKDEDPTECPFGPTILDIEITSICNGVTNDKGKKELCSFCYKANTGFGHNMSFETFKKILDKFPKDSSGSHVLTQVAFGVDSSATSNPDLFEMMDYCRSLNIIPNLTVADISDETAEQLIKRAGACAVSLYRHGNNFETGIESIEKLTHNAFNKLGTTLEDFEATYSDPVSEYKKQKGVQINIHFFLSRETVLDAYTVIQKLKTDPRMKYVNAIVFLFLKQKGRGEGFTTVGNESYHALMDWCFENNLDIGMDTCGAVRFLNYIKMNQPQLIDKVTPFVEYCCAGRISAYVNEYGEYFPCSFCEKVGDWKDGINLLEINDFVTELWKNEKVKTFACKTLECVNNGRGCQVFDV